MTLRSNFDRVANKPFWEYLNKGKWVPVPKDEHGLPPVEWLRSLGHPLIRSEIKTERHTSLCGKYRYTAGYRVDTYAKGYRIPIEGSGSESRRTADGEEEAWLYINEENNPTPTHMP
jgi:hypothetical protein